MNKFGMNPEEVAYQKKLQVIYKEALKGDYHEPPPDNLRLTTKRWLEAVEEFVKANPGAMVLAVDNPEWRCFGMSASTSDEAVTLHVVLPLTALREEAPLSIHHHVLGDKFTRRDVAQRLARGEILSTKLVDWPQASHLGAVEIQ